MSEDNLEIMLKYIHSEKAAGHSDQDIVQALLTGGWSVDYANYGIKVSRAETDAHQKHIESNI